MKYVAYVSLLPWFVSVTVSAEDSAYRNPKEKKKKLARSCHLVVFSVFTGVYLALVVVAALVVGQLELAERHFLSHPVSSSVRRIRVHVHPVSWKFKQNKKRLSKYIPIIIKLFAKLTKQQGKSSTYCISIHILIYILCCWQQPTPISMKNQ